MLDGLEPPVGFVHAVAVARLAAQGVGDHAGVVARTVVHGLHALQVFVAERRVVRGRAAHAAVVALLGGVDVGPVDDLQPQFVAEPVEPLRLRVVGGEGVVSLFAERLQLGCGGLGIGCGVIARNVEIERLAEADELPVDELRAAESDPQRHILLVGAVAPREEHDLVEGRVLGARLPLVFVGVVDERREAHGVGRTAGDRGFDDVELQQLVLRRIDVVTHFHRFVVVEHVLRDDLQVEHGEIAAERVGHERDLEVADRTLVLVVEVAVGERLAPDGLGEVQPAAVAEQEQLEVVDALPDVGRQVELGRREGVVDAGRFAVVDPQGVGRRGVFEMEIDAAVGPDVGDFDLLPEHGAERPLGGEDRLGAEVARMARRGAAAGVGMVAGIVGHRFGAADAGVLLGCGARADQQRRTER